MKMTATCRNREKKRPALTEVAGTLLDERGDARAAGKRMIAAPARAGISATDCRFSKKSDISMRQ